MKHACHTIHVGLQRLTDKTDWRRSFNVPAPDT